MTGGALLTFSGAPDQATLPASRALASQATLTLRPGVRFPAEVIATPQPGQATLKIGQQILQVRTTTSLAVGEQLSLQVTHAGRLLVLARRDEAPGATPGRGAAGSLQDVTQGLLRQQLPAQRSLSELLAVTSALARSSAGAGASRTLPPALHQAARGFLAALPRRADLTSPAGVARALQWSTTRSTTSSNLWKTIGALLAQVPPDHPAAERRTAGPGAASDRLPPLPGHGPVPQARLMAGEGEPSSLELRRLVQGASARLDLLALTATLPRPRERAALAAEIPVQSAGEQYQSDVIGLRVAHEQASVEERDGRSGDARAGLDPQESTHRWRVELAFDLPGVGPLKAEVTLCEETHVSVCFRGAQGAAAARLQDRLGELAERLGARGLQVNTVQAGSESASQQPHPMTMRQPVVDEHV